MDILKVHKNNQEFSYYYDDNHGAPVYHGEHKVFYFGGKLCEHLFYYHGVMHGEYRHYDRSGELGGGTYFINGVSHPYVEMNAQEKLLYQIQYPGFRFIED